jgi:hypothetical protein
MKNYQQKVEGNTLIFTGCTMHPIVCTNSLIRLHETYGNLVELATA